MISYIKSKYRGIHQSIERLNNRSTFYLGDNVALTKLFTDQFIYVDTRDTSVAPHLMIDGHWEPEITQVWIKLAKSSSVIFDIGANFGYYGLISGRGADRADSSFHFFEPNPNLISMIKRSCSINGLGNNSKINQLAVSDKVAKHKFIIYDHFFGSSRIQTNRDTPNENFPIKETISVTSTTVDKYVKEERITKIDLVKIDVEGHEDSTYKGMKNTIKANKDIKIMLEFTPGAYADSESFFKTICSDFKCVYAIKGSNSLTATKSYSKLKKLADNDWIMLLLTNSEFSL